MSWVITGSQPFPAVIGEEFGGGFFAGYISHTADGNPTHALIVAPRATGATGTGYPSATEVAWKTTQTLTTGAVSLFDGAANTAAMVATGIENHPAAQFCVNLSIGGFNDWYLPSIRELDIAFFNLKPSTALNNTNFGINDYSVPKRIANNTANYPSITHVASFAGGSERIEASGHWSSSDINATNAWYFNFAIFGPQSNRLKDLTLRTRAFRRIAL